MFSVLSIRKRAQFEYIFHFTEKESGSQMKNKIITLCTNDIYIQTTDRYFNHIQETEEHDHLYELKSNIKWCELKYIFL